MTRIALILMVVCAIAGGVFYMWNSHENTKSAPAVAVAPPVEPTKQASRDADFGPYMAELQRRIKRAWYPPKSHESDRIQVIFKVQTNGTMSHLRVSKASSSAIANQAALKAVQNAAPFSPLPDGAPESVDIQFTFDYNVFKGKAGGTYRRF